MSSVKSSLAPSGVFVHVVEGQALAEEMFAAAFSWHRAPDYKAEIPVLWDIRDGWLDVSLGELVGTYGQHIHDANKSRPLGRTAWVVPNPRNTAVLEEIRSEIAWLSEWKIFRKSQYNEAIDWLSPSIVPIA